MTVTTAMATAPELTSLYQVMPAMSDEDYQRLKESIAGFYERHGAPLWPGGEVVVDDEGRILDGHHRAKACAELGFEFPTRVAEEWSEDDKWDFAFRSNLARRHLTADQRKELVAEYLRHYPTASDRQAAQASNVSPTTAGRIRQTLVASGEIEDTIRPHQRTDQRLSTVDREPVDNWDDSDIPDRFYAIRAEIDVNFRERNPVLRHRGDKEYPREAKAFRRVLEVIIDAAAREEGGDGEEGLKRFATVIAEQVWKDPEIRRAWKNTP